jgi:sugar lactone lactonase YvrE
MPGSVHSVIDTYVLPPDVADVMPEGIAEDRDGLTFYISSARHGTIYRGRVDLPELELWQPAGVDERTQATGMTVDPQGRLLVCGWETGHVFAYDTATSALCARVTVRVEVTGLNDICIFDGYAYVTDSRRPVIWRIALAGDGQSALGEPEEWLDLREFGAPEPDDSFLNGIVPAREARALPVSDQAEEVLWRVDVAGRSAVRVDLGGQHLCADGMVWADGGLLYACDNSEEDGTIRMWLTAIRIADDARTGVVVGRWERPLADTPTTLAHLGGRLYVVNSQMFVERAGGQLTPPFTVSALRPPTA